MILDYGIVTSNLLHTSNVIYGLQHGNTGGTKHIFTLLSVLASVVGSQATITATFSIINQLQALNCFPRVKVVHTSERIHGQIYIPDVNWILMALCLAFTIAVKDVANMGNATGNH